MTKTGSVAYYRKERDLLMWAEFDALAGKLATPASSLLTEAAREYVERHKNDPRPPLPVPPNKRRHPDKPFPPDPFALKD